MYYNKIVEQSSVFLTLRPRPELHQATRAIISQWRFRNFHDRYKKIRIEQAASSISWYFNKVIFISWIGLKIRSSNHQRSEWPPISQGFRTKRNENWEQFIEKVKKLVDNILQHKLTKPVEKKIWRWQMWNLLTKFDVIKMLSRNSKISIMNLKKSNLYRFCMKENLMSILQRIKPDFQWRSLKTETIMQRGQHIIHSMA